MASEETPPRRPSLAYFLIHGDRDASAEDVEKVEPGSAQEAWFEHMYWREQVDVWLTRNADPFEATEEMRQAALDHAAYVRGTKPDVDGSPPEARDSSLGRLQAVRQIEQLAKVEWWRNQHGIIAWRVSTSRIEGIDYWRVPPGREIPDFVEALLPYAYTWSRFPRDREEGLLGITPRPAQLPRPIISPAFRHDGREGLGRISSSQISQGIFAACIASKEAWGKTSKGFPRYTHSVQSGEIEITLRPEVESKDEKKIGAQIGEMEAIRDELSISDWDMACILMEQALTENGGHGTAYISDADACDYRKLEKNRKEGFAAGHHPDNRKRASDAINRLVHLWIRTDTLEVRQVDEKGKLGGVTVNWREKYITIRKTLDRQDSEATIGWYYEFGASFTTFLQRPNNFIAYLLQETIALKASQESAKTVAHYIALRMRVDAQHGPAYDLAMGKLVEAAHLPCNEARAKETIQMNEATLRTCVKAGLFRIKTKDGDVLHADTPLTQLKAWTLAPPNLRGKALLKEWKRQKVIILAVLDIEQRYDRLRKNGRSSEQVAGR